MLLCAAVVENGWRDRSAHGVCVMLSQGAATYATERPERSPKFKHTGRRHQLV